MESSEDLRARRRRSIIMLVLGVPILAVAFYVRTTPTSQWSRRSGHPFPFLFVIGAFMVGSGGYGAVAATRNLRRRDK